MTNTDPAAFSSETTGVFKVQPLGEAVPLSNVGGVGSEPIEGFHERIEAQAHVNEYGHPSDCQGCAACQTPPVQDTAYGYVAPFEPETHKIAPPSPVSLTYAWSDGYTFSRVDQENELTHRTGDGDENEHRERLLLRALLEHTLAMIKGEDVS